MSLILRCSKYLLNYTFFNSFIVQGKNEDFSCSFVKKGDTIKLNSSEEVNVLTSCTKKNACSFLPDSLRQTVDFPQFIDGPQGRRDNT